MADLGGSGSGRLFHEVVVKTHSSEGWTGLEDLYPRRGPHLAVVGRPPLLAEQTCLSVFMTWRLASPGVSGPREIKEQYMLGSIPGSHIPLILSYL